MPYNEPRCQMRLDRENLSNKYCVLVMHVNKHVKQ